MALSALPMGAFGIRPEWLQAPQGIQSPELAPAPTAMETGSVLPDLRNVPTQRKRGFAQSDDFYSGLLRGGGALLSGKGLGGWAESMGDSLDLYKKRQTKTQEAIDPSKYAFQTIDPETGQASIEINDELRQAYLDDLKTKGTIVKPMSEYQQDQSQRGWTGIGQKGEQFDRKQSETERRNLVLENMIATGQISRSTAQALSLGLQYGKEGADVPEGYEMPTPGVPGAPGNPDPQGGFDSVYDGFVKPTEGGYTARDGRSGAPANFGINQKANPDIDVRNLTPEAARQIYKDRYWGPSGADQIQDPKLQGIHFDTAVNMGVETSKRILQESGGDPARYMALREARHRSLGGSEQGTWAARNQSLRQYSGVGGQTPPGRIAVPRVKVANTTTAPSTFKVGQSINGHTFKGGDPKDRNNWS